MTFQDEPSISFDILIGLQVLQGLWTTVNLKKQPKNQ